MWYVWGCYKVLGKGKLPRLPVMVKAKVSSQRTEKRMKGVCVSWGAVSWWLETTWEEVH